MPRNGTGTYILPSGQPVVSGSIISADTHNTLMNDVATALTTSVSTDGQTPMLSNLSMGNNKIINLKNATGAQDAVTLGQLATRAFNAINVVNATSTLASSVVGGLVQIAGSTSAITLTLPVASTISPGIGTITICNSSAYDATLTPQGSDTLAHVKGLTTGNIILTPGDYITITNQSSAAWIAINGSAEQGINQSLAYNGYRILPGGMIIQWGSFTATTGGVTSNGVAEASLAVHYPIAFPNNMFSVIAGVNDVNGAGLQEIVAASSADLTAFIAIMSCRIAYTPMTGHYIAIGN